MSEIIRDEKVVYVFTVKGYNYAVETINTIEYNKFDKNEYIIYAIDNEAKNLFDSLGYDCRDSFGINVYMDKLFNPLTLSNKDPDTYYIAIDAASEYPTLYHRKMFEDEIIDQLNYEEDNTVLLFSYDDSVTYMRKTDWTKDRIACGIMAFKGVKDITYDCIMKYYDHIKNIDFTFNTDYTQERYQKQTGNGLTEEIFLSMYTHHTKAGKHINKFYNTKFINTCFMLTQYGGADLNRLLTGEYSLKDLETNTGYKWIEKYYNMLKR